MINWFEEGCFFFERERQFEGWKVSLEFLLRLFILRLFILLRLFDCFRFEFKLSLIRLKGWLVHTSTFDVLLLDGERDSSDRCIIISRNKGKGVEKNLFNFNEWNHLSSFSTLNLILAKANIYSSILFKSYLNESNEGKK